MFKALLGTACVAIIAAVGYFFWGEWQAYRAEHIKTVELASDKRLDQCGEVGAAIDNWVANGKPAGFDREGYGARMSSCVEDFSGSIAEDIYRKRLELVR